ncbi:cytochrome P450 724B1 [Cornus florida]|uniref:cytochrome P450 724B1 n=1 Tax=Cornus florida TaxID=4283 RepID=UPI0028A10329|nr:cytochrome P450 724B1 [Cornus florida]
MMGVGLASVAIAVLLGVPALVFLILHTFFAKQDPTSLPRGNMGWPFLGETIGYLKPHRSNTMGTFLQTHCSWYGKVFKSHLFGCPTIVSCDHDLNTFVLQNEEKLFQSSYPKPVHGILGKLSMMLVSGDLHRKLRSVAVSFIATSRSMPEFLHSVEKLTISVMKSWEDRQEVAFFREAKEFTLYVMLKYLLSIEPEDLIASSILEDFLTFMKGFISLPLNVPGSSYAKAVKARTRISSTLKEVIKERQNGNGGLAKKDFLDGILVKENLSNEEKVSVLLDLLLAGYETTSALLGIVVYFLGQAPHVLEHLKAEHQEIRKNKKDGEPLNWEDYKQMEFTSNVISESLRCGNVVKFVHRKALQDVTFKGYLIPSGWKVLPVLTAANLDPSLHEDPSDFNPWRWTDQAMSKKVNPFGGGLRLCPGAELAKVETACFLHHLVLNYRWKIKGDDFPISCPFLEFKRGLVLELEPLEKKIGSKA